VADVLSPDRLRGKITRGRGDAFQLGRSDLGDLIVKAVSGKDDRDAEHGDNQRFHGFHDGRTLL